MPQETNLNVAPYFDDFETDSNYYKVLFKPSYPVQARELNNLQSILQNQVEDVGSHLFKEGSQVIPGGVDYIGSYPAIQVQEEFLGIPISLYLDQLVGQRIKGETSGVTAKVVNYITNAQSDRETYTLYLEYNASSVNGDSSVFGDDEVLLLEESITYATTFIAAGEGFAKTLSVDASAVGSAFAMSEGVYFLRGYFVDVDTQVLILDQYSNKPSYRIGLKVEETLVNSDVDQTLNDNSSGFNNFTAPGADRLQIVAKLAKKDSDDFNDQNFVQLAEVQDGVLRSIQNHAKYNQLGNELARRTFDESGHYYINEYVTTAHESLNDGFGNRGLFDATQTTPGGATPSENLGIYKISPGKAYVRGYEVEVRAPTFLDFTKPRTTKTLETQPLNFGFGPTFAVNNAYGSASIGFNTTNVLSLRSERKGESGLTTTGKEIGVARVYDCALESGTMVAVNGTLPATNQWDLSLWDVQTFTDFTLSDSTTLAVPTHIHGKSSGATAFLRSAVTAGTAITAYDVKGKFSIGERLEFNGIGTHTRVATAVTDYGISDVQSVYGTHDGLTGTAGTFSADLIPTVATNIGIVSITPYSSNGGVSTVTTNNIGFTSAFGVNGTWPGIVSIGNLVRFSDPNSDSFVPTLAKVTEVNINSIKIVGVTSVSGVFTGDLPTAISNINDFAVVNSSRKSHGGNGNASRNDSLYSILPKKNISSVNLTDSNIVIRHEYRGETIGAGGSTGSITPVNGCTFLPFDEERYTVIRSDGSLESLTEDKVVFETGGNIIFAGLSASDTGVTILTTQRKTNVTAKSKLNNNAAFVLIDKSTNSSSGIGGTTLNDGLTFGEYPFGTRVQDSSICLNVPDVVMLYGVYQSSDTSDPSAPSMTTGSMSGSSATTNDVIVGEEIIGNSSGAKGLYINRINDTSVNFIYENNSLFENGETVTFSDSGVTAVVSNIDAGSDNIIRDFKFDSGQRSTFLDYSRLTRRSDVDIPSKKLKVYYQSASFAADDTGDITTVGSYSNFDYSGQLGIVNGVRVSDIVDARPIVNQYTVSENSNSPFEFAGRLFNDSQNSSQYVLASDENMTIDYSFYLGRMDRIYLNVEGNFVVNYGTPSETPGLPPETPGALNIATVALPPYLFDASAAKISFINHKRYQMNDISKLEQRIKNLEYYPSLNTVESNALSQQIVDANGLSRFKSGIYVDDFSNFAPQDCSVGVRNALDKRKQVLRPALFTTQVNMDIGNNSIAGIGTTTESNQDSRFADILGSNVKRDNEVLMLDYTEERWLRQPFATRSESVTPFLVRFWEGSIRFTPTTDVWIDVNQMQVRDVLAEGSFTGVAEAMNATVTDAADGSRVGVSPMDWGSWETIGVNVGFDLSMSQTQQSSFSDRQGTAVEFIDMMGTGTREGWTASSAINHMATNAGGMAPSTFTVQEENIETTTHIGGQVSVGLNQQRRGTQTTVNEQIDTSSLGNRIVNRNIIRFMRSRNIQFDATRLKPYTQVYPFFDGVDVSRFCMSKLMEVTMTSGTFVVGETVTGVMPSTNNTRTTDTQRVSPRITFRVASANHLAGPYNRPTDTFDRNPYDRENRLPATYSETTTVLNVDTFSLADEATPQWSGYIQTGMVLTGAGGAQATVSNVRLITNRLGTLMGSFRVPSSANPANPTFETGRTRLRLTSSPIDSRVEGVTTTAAEEIFYSQGDLDNAQQVTLSLRNARVSRRNETQTRTISGDASASASAVTDVETRLTGVYTDPLAQSFSVDDTTGVYITSVDVYFQAKDTAGIPVTMQIREMQLGTPSDVILEYSEVDMDPDDITVSENSSVGTNFQFQSPVYLAAQREYCVVLLSTSTEYRVWIARMGESDVGTLGREAGQIIVSTQPLLGSLFKSQNASTWTPSQYEDLTFQVHRAKFESNGSVQFFNPSLPEDDQLLSTNPLTPLANEVRIGLSSIVEDTVIQLGNTIYQYDTQARGDLVGYGGSIVSGKDGSGNFTPSAGINTVNRGTGYTPLTGNGKYEGVDLVSITGSGMYGTVDISIENGVAIAATVAIGGTGYVVGDVLGVTTVGVNPLGQLGTGLRWTVAELQGNNQLVVNNVQGDFATAGVGRSIFYYTNNAETASTELNAVQGGGVLVDSVNSTHDGLHMKVFCRNHGMHASGNRATLSEIQSNVVPLSLDTAYPNTGTGNITLSTTLVGSAYTQFEGIAIGATNPGYVKVGSEVISYTGTSGADLTGISRGIDDTVSATHPASDLVYKYEMNGVSLRRINRTHDLSEVTISDPITLDSYHVKLDVTDTDYGTRRDGTVFGKALKFNSGVGCGGVESKSTYNVPFELCVPKFNTTVPTGTSLRASIRTTSGTSIDGSESSFVDKGFQDLSLNQENYFDSPRIVAAKANEDLYLTSLPGNKSLTVNLNLSSGDDRLSPAIDIDQTSMIFSSNRINSPIANYATDFRVNTVEDDPSRFFYVTQNVEVENPATSLQVYLDAYVNNSADLRVFYAIDQDGDVDDTVFIPFPGYGNLNPSRPGIVVDAAASDGTSDLQVNKTDNFILSPNPTSFQEYKWSADRLSSFTKFRIKIIGSSTNQAYPPQLRNLRVFALA